VCEMKYKTTQSKKSGGRRGREAIKCVRSDDLDAIGLQGIMGWGWGCVEVDESSRWSQLTGRDGRKGKDPRVMMTVVLM